MVVVDTSVLIDLLKGNPTPAAERLAQWDADGVPFWIPLVCVQEVLQGARDEREWRALGSHLESQRLLIPEDPISLHREAARMFYDCRRKGISVRGTVDCFIAAQVLAKDATLLHDDADFDRLARVRPLKVMRA